MERASALINDSSQVWLICTVNKRHTSRHTACAVFLSLSRFGLCIRFTLVPFKFEPLTKAIRSIALQWLISKKWTQHIKMRFGFVCVFFTRLLFICIASHMAWNCCCNCYFWSHTSVRHVFFFISRAHRMHVRSAHTHTLAIYRVHAAFDTIFNSFFVGR